MPACPAYPGDAVNCGDFAIWSQTSGSGPTTTTSAMWPDWMESDQQPCQSLSGAPATAMPMPTSGSATPVQVLGAGGVTSSCVSAVAVKVTATAAGAPGYVQAVPTQGPTRHGACSNLNLNLEQAGQTS